MVLRNVLPLCRNVLPRTQAVCVRWCFAGRKTAGTSEDAYFERLYREKLNKLKQAKPGIDEADEGVRLEKILDTVIATDGTKGVRKQIRSELKTQLLLWKHDQDIKKAA